MIEFPSLIPMTDDERERYIAPLDEYFEKENDCTIGAIEFFSDPYCLDVIQGEDEATRLEQANQWLRSDTCTEPPFKFNNDPLR